VGLGNPGSEYEGTRHNIGFAVVDALAALLRIPLRAQRGNYRAGAGSAGGRSVLLVQPMTYMNNSGEAVREIVATHGLEVRNLLVIVDDFHIPLGVLRIRAGGSDGGHNGLYSIGLHLQSEEFPRLRCGIGSAEMPVNKKEMARFVLSPFASGELETVRGLIERARDAAVAAVTEGLEAAIAGFNGKSRARQTY
jgi:PTH1 family peptidyl-tRNA hydrolase